MNKYILITAGLIAGFFVGCSTSDVNVDGGTNNKVEANVNINYNAPLCLEHPAFADATIEQIQACIDGLTTIEGQVEATVLSDTLSQDQIDALLGFEEDNVGQ